LTIGEVARRAGVATSSIRYYESIGLLPEPARAGGQRRYTEDVLGQLAFIGTAKAAGFKLREISALLDGDGIGPRMRMLSAQKLPEIEALMAQADARRRWLEAASDCECGSPDECTLFDADGNEVSDPTQALQLVRVDGSGCRRED
jgi:MerR family transcriptional regulator, redox-sensitive transcriptional activator SoxR